MNAKKIRPVYRMTALAFVVLIAFQVIVGEVSFIRQAVAATLPSPMPTRTPTIIPTSTASPWPTAKPAPTLFPTLSDYGTYQDSAKFSLAQLGYTEVVINYPDSEEVFVAMPDQWRLKGTSKFTMHYTLYDQWAIKPGTSQNTYLNRMPPTLVIYVNDLLAATFTPQPGPDHYFTFEIPYQTTDRVSINPSNYFNFRFDYVNLNDIYCDYIGVLKIHDDSVFGVDFETLPPTLDLSRFPVPISQNSSIPETVYFIIPDNFSGSDLSAAATAAAMISKGTTSPIKYKLFKESDRLKIPEKASVVVIGTPSKNKYLSDVLYRYKPGMIGLPSSLRGDKIYLTSANRMLRDDEGLVQLMESEKNQRYTYLVLTGNTDEGVELAAKGLSSPPLGQVGTGFVVPPTFKLPEYKLDNVVTFKSLGFNSSTFYGLGSAARNITFYVPRNWKMEEGTALVLRYRNSDNLDELNSSLVIYINDQPVGSSRVEVKKTGEKEATFIINKADIRPGWLNVLRIEANINSRLICLYNPRSFFVNIQETSLLLLPHSLVTDPKQLSPIVHPIYYMGTKPDIYVSMPAKPTYEDMNMLLSFAALFSSLRLPTVNFEVGLGTQDDLAAKGKFNILMIGRPSTNAQIARVNKDLPQRFVSGTDTLEQMVGSVAYQVPPGVSVGLMQVIPSPFDPEMGLTLISGTTEEGMKYVYDRLTISPDLLSIAGDLVFIGKQTVKAFITQGIPIAVDLASSGVTGTQVALQPVPTEGVVPSPAPTEPSRYVSTVSAANPLSQMLGRYLLSGLLVAGLVVFLVALVRTTRGGRRF